LFLYPPHGFTSTLYGFQNKVDECAVICKKHVTHNFNNLLMVFKQPYLENSQASIGCPCNKWCIMLTM